jgi:very-short-patch-repair endonuclease
MHDRERRLAAIASRQHGLVTREQLRSVGIERGALEHRLRAGLLARVLPRVYALAGSQQTVEQRLAAAVLYAGQGAVVSHRSAAEFWSLLPHTPGRAVDVTIACGQARSRPGVCVHRSRTLHAREIRQRWRIPLTSPARTLLDLADSEPFEVLEAAFTEALVHSLSCGEEIRALLRRSPPHRGARRLLSLLAVEEEQGYTRSAAERLLRAMLAPTGLPMPEFNVLTAGHLVDCRWRKQRLIVYVDGYQTHGTRAAFESDRRADQDLVAAGYRVIRVTWRQLTQHPERVLVRIAQALAVAAVAGDR